MTSRRRVAGILVPLFSIPSTESWGIGEFGDIPAFASWMHRAGLGVLQMLPLNESHGNEASPYSPLSAMALDPQFISLRLVQDFAASGGEAALDSDIRERLKDARCADRIDYPRIRAAKYEALRRSFDWFVAEDWSTHSPRARALQQYVADEAWWVEPYSLFRAVRTEQGERAWKTWPEALQCASAEALVDARSRLDREVRFFQYLQWIAEGQWQSARQAAHPVAIFGDFPFLVTGDSADVWTRQDEFLLDSSVGAPPDAFSKSGQDWGLPPCNWPVMAARGDEWLRQRVRRMAALYDGFRIDHLVGFYRTYIRPRHGTPYFMPGDEAEQLHQGERLIEIFRDSGARITVEDLGDVPPFVRASVARQGLAGYSVMRWERYWDEPGQPFRDPEQYPTVSVATTGTHDTDALAEWWESITPQERASIAALPTVSRLTGDARALRRPKLDAQPRDIILETMYAAASDLVILPVQDLFGWRSRINKPGTVSDDNWTFKLPWPADRLEAQPEPLACADRLRPWAERHRRL